MKNIHLLFAILLLFAFELHAQITLVNDGAHIFIDTGIVTTVQGNLTNKNNGVIDSDGTLKVSRYFTNTASFDQDTGLVILNGTTTQRVAGDTSTFYWLEVDNPSGAIVTAGVNQIRHTLNLVDGTFDTNDSLVLLSNHDLTARVAAIPSGADLIGDIIMQRYLDNGVTGWHIIGTATSGGDLSEWNDDIVTSGFTGSDYPSFPFNNIYTYNEAAFGTSDQGYKTASNISNSIFSSRGYWTYIGPVPLTLDSKGPAHKFNQSFPVTYTTSAGRTHDGWNMVANPYPSNIDWAGRGWSKGRIDDAIYQYDPDNGVYASYVSGVSTNGGSRYIASSQGFWVKANGPLPSLTATEDVKTDVKTTFFRKKADLSTAPLLRLKVIASGGGLTDETVLALSPIASGLFDSEHDAYKLEDEYSSAPYIASVLDTIDLSINALPKIANEGEIPLRVKVKSTGNYSLEISRERQIEFGNCLYLEDLDNNNVVDLKQDSTYSFHMNDSVILPRFIIHTNPKIELGNDTLIVGGESFILDAGEGFTAYSWSNGARTKSIEVADSGLYWVQVKNKFGCVGTDSIHIGLQGVTALPKNISDESSILVYPNPVKDFFVLETNNMTPGDYTLMLYDPLGQLVVHRDVQINTTKHQERINCNNLARGQYFVKLIGSSSTYVNKVTLTK